MPFELLFQMNLITKQLYDVIIEGDQEDVSRILHDCELKAMTSKPGEKKTVNKQVA